MRLSMPRKKPFLPLQISPTTISMAFCLSAAVIALTSKLSGIKSKRASKSKVGCVLFVSTKEEPLIPSVNATAVGIVVRAPIRAVKSSDLYTA